MRTTHKASLISKISTPLVDVAGDSEDVGVDGIGKVEAGGG